MQSGPSKITASLITPQRTGHPQEVGEGAQPTIDDWAAQRGYAASPKRSFQPILVRQARFEVLEWSSISFQNEGESPPPPRLGGHFLGTSLLWARCLHVCGALAAGLRMPGSHACSQALASLPLCTPTAVSFDRRGSADGESGCVATPWDVVRMIPDSMTVVALRCKNTKRLVVAASMVRTRLYQHSRQGPVGPLRRAPSALRRPQSSALATRDPR
jgi:hypothetical protein